MDELAASLLIITIWVIGLALPALIFGAIFQKAGYSPWRGLLMLVPLVNVIWLIVFAFSEWPIHRELARHRTLQGEATPEDFSVATAEAARLESHGDWQEALVAYDRLARLPGNPNAEYAANCADRLRHRHKDQDATSS
ncbi:MAG: hypothetical protein WDZ31_01895 [Phycisphaeraceae bacterium]